MSSRAEEGRASAEHCGRARGWSLAEIQDWMRLAVATPHGLSHGLARARERYGAAHPLRVRDDGRSAERLAIYARGYLTRLLECLHADYPALRALLGESLFDGFALAYLAAHPPCGYSLFELGAGFPDHLERSCPPESAVPESQRALLRLPVDIARLERARLEASRAPAPRNSLVPVLGLEWLASECTLRTAPGVRIVSLAHDVRGFLAAVDAVSSVSNPVRLPRPEARALRLAVSSVSYRPVFCELEPWQDELLTACRSPRSAMDLAALDAGEPGARLADLLLWLPAAQALGLLEFEST